MNLLLQARIRCCDRQSRRSALRDTIRVCLSASRLRVPVSRRVCTLSQRTFMNNAGSSTTCPKPGGAECVFPQEGEAYRCDGLTRWNSCQATCCQQPCQQMVDDIGVGQLSGHLTFLIIDSALIALITRLRRKPRLPALCSSLLRRMDQDLGLHRIPLHVL